MPAKKKVLNEVAELKTRLAEAEELLSAIKSGAVDAFVTDDHRVFTLESSDRAYRILFETMNEGAATLSYDGTVMCCNRRFAGMFGLAADETVGKSVLDLVNPSELARFKNFLKVSRKKTGRAEFRFRKAPKAFIPALVSCSPLKIDTRGLCLVITDLTKQKEAELELKNHREHLKELVKARTNELVKSEERYRLAVKATNDAIWDLDLTNGLAYWNDIYTEMFHRPQDTNRSWKWWADQIHPEDRNRAVSGFSKALRGKDTAWICEYRFLRPDGTWAQVYDRAYIARDESGKAYRVIGAMSDITQRKRFEEELKTYAENLEGLVWQRSKEVLSERHRLFNVLETVPAMVCLLTADHRVAFANKAFRERFGESQGRKCHDYCFGNKEPCDFCESYKVLETGKPHRWEVHASDGSIIEAYDYPFTDSDGSPVILEMDIDVTEQRRAADALIATKIELERAKRLSDIGTLAATVAHELRNPLAAILMAAENIQRKSKEAAAFDHQFRTIEKKIEESDQIINNLLFYSRLRSPDLKSVKIHDIIQRCVDLAENQSAGKVVFTKRFDPVKSALIEADALQMQEVFSNLLNNARDSITDGRGTIEVSALQDRDTVTAKIKDNGVGIEKKNLERIFDPFFSTKAKGTGLGLTVCREIIHMHGGAIGFRSEPGKGTAVEIVLPKLNKKKV